MTVRKGRTSTGLFEEKRNVRGHFFLTGKENPEILGKFKIFVFIMCLQK